MAKEDQKNFLIEGISSANLERTVSSGFLQSTLNQKVPVVPASQIGTGAQTSAPAPSSAASNASTNPLKK